MCNVYCQGNEHKAVIGSLISDIEALRKEEVGKLYEVISEELSNYSSHGWKVGTVIEIVDIEPAIEGTVPRTQIEDGYVFPVLVTVAVKE